MISGINDELILVARLLPSDSISDFRLEKGEGLFGHRKSNGAALRPDAGPGYCCGDLHGASGCVRRRCSRVRASATTTYHRVTIDSVGVFYREAGPKDAPNLMLLFKHGNRANLIRSSPCSPHTII